MLLYPSHSTPAPYHGQALVRTFNFAYTGIFNILGLPVTQVRNLVKILFLARFLLASAQWESLLESRFTLIKQRLVEQSLRDMSSLFHYRLLAVVTWTG